jgi:hypothetical protein
MKIEVGTDLDLPGMKCDFKLPVLSSRLGCTPKPEQATLLPTFHFQVTNGAPLVDMTERSPSRSGLGKPSWQT